MENEECKIILYSSFLILNLKNEILFFNASPKGSMLLPWLTLVGVLATTRC